MDLIDRIYATPIRLDRNRIKDLTNGHEEDDRRSVTLHAADMS
jgi:hypothetical protein